MRKQECPSCGKKFKTNPNCLQCQIGEPPQWDSLFQKRNKPNNGKRRKDSYSCLIKDSEPMF